VGHAEAGHGTFPYTPAGYPPSRPPMPPNPAAAWGVQGQMAHNPYGMHSYYGHPTQQAAAMWHLQQQQYMQQQMMYAAANANANASATAARAHATYAKTKSSVEVIPLPKEEESKEGGKEELKATTEEAKVSKLDGKRARPDSDKESSDDEKAKKKKKKKKKQKKREASSDSESRAPSRKYAPLPVVRRNNFSEKKSIFTEAPPPPPGLPPPPKAQPPVTPPVMVPYRPPETKFDLSLIQKEAMQPIIPEMTGYLAKIKGIILAEALPQIGRLTESQQRQLIATGPIAIMVPNPTAIVCARVREIINFHMRQATKNSFELIGPSLKEQQREMHERDDFNDNLALQDARRAKKIEALTNQAQQGELTYEQGVGYGRQLNIVEHLELEAQQKQAQLEVEAQKRQTEFQDAHRNIAQVTPGNYRPPNLQVLQPPSVSVPGTHPTPSLQPLHSGPPTGSTSIAPGQQAIYPRPGATVGTLRPDAEQQQQQQWPMGGAAQGTPSQAGARDRPSSPRGVGGQQQSSLHLAPPRPSAGAAPETTTTPPHKPKVEPSFQPPESSATQATRAASPISAASASPPMAHLHAIQRPVRAPASVAVPPPPPPNFPPSYPESEVLDRDAAHGEPKSAPSLPPTTGPPRPSIARALRPPCAASEAPGSSPRGDATTTNAATRWPRESLHPLGLGVPRPDTTTHPPPEGDHGQHAPTTLQHVARPPRGGPMPVRPSYAGSDTGRVPGMEAPLGVRPLPKILQHVNHNHPVGLGSVPRPPASG